MEFNIGEDKIIKDFMLHVHDQGGNPVETILAFTQPNAWSAWDLETCEYLQPGEDSYKGWQDYFA